MYTIMSSDRGLSVLVRCLHHSIEEMHQYKSRGRQFNESPFYHMFLRLLPQYARESYNGALAILEKFVDTLHPPIEAIPLLPDTYR